MTKEHLQTGQYIDPETLGRSTLELLQVSDISTVQILNPWYQGGAETFVTDFLLRSGKDKTLHLIAKACIKMCARATMKEWFERREALGENGVSFPNVHATDYEGATWVEEFIPYTFREAHKQADRAQQRSLEDQYAQMYLRIEGAGFKPLGALHDVRSHGTDVVMIDVGEDIGGKVDIQSCDIDAKTRARQSLAGVIYK
jgi:hypothetical protein